MSTTKKLEEKVNSINTRMSSLRDDMVTLQSELANIVDKIQKDMNR